MNDDVKKSIIDQTAFNLGQHLKKEFELIKDPVLNKFIGTASGHLYYEVTIMMPPVTKRMSSAFDIESYTPSAEISTSEKFDKNSFAMHTWNCQTEVLDYFRSMNIEIVNDSRGTLRVRYLDVLRAPFMKDYLNTPDGLAEII